ncbi:hypothetical protein [Adhaeribacter radiodurans]|uniref:Uncharacterized protein n=1 Tax=Adhaeribacter radiodurans TaxID=2745197 RepID=A0A7L7LCH8_9BACT|nr:hypothetical protein [Adhaeribacter radiodurans]QMU30521.1 hypothetical protein HUW48_21955 [Adhaeribacter radiodurans]
MSNIIEYYLPEKVFKLTIKYFIKEELTIREDRADTKILECYIQDDIALDLLLLPEFNKKCTYDYSKFKSFWYQTTFTVCYDENGAGLLQSINTESNPILKDVIKGTVDFASSLLKLGIGIPLAAPPVEEQPTEMVETRERTISIVHTIRTAEMLIAPDKSFYYKIINSPFNQKNNVKFPDVELIIKPYGMSKVVEWQDQAIKDSTKIFYRDPVLCNVRVLIRNNSSINEQEVINEYDYFPQFGELNTIMLTKGNMLNKTGNVIEFSKNTGGLQKIGLTTESHIKETVENSNSTVGTISKLVSDIKANKELGEQDKKAKVGDTETKLRIEQEKEIEELKKLKELLELRAEVSKLQGITL